MPASSHRIALLLVLLAGASSRAPAQWVFTAEVGGARFWGASAPIGGDGPSFHPYRPTVFGVGVERQGTRLGWGVQLQYAGASLALEGKDAVAAVKGVVDIYGIAPELTVLVKRFETGLRLGVFGGPLLEFWDIGAELSHTRIGAQLGVGLQVPLGTRVLAGVSVSGAVSPSPFEERDLEGGYEPRTLWRRKMSATVRYRL
ncbi:MAG TPA: hypothetical protein VH763_13870 [Gemmatimonadales bacterium]